jgi:ATP/ADP translocase
MKAVHIKAFDSNQERIWYFLRLTTDIKQKLKSAYKSIFRRIGGCLQQRQDG